MYGGAVVQYGLTIGLFFSSLGVGSYLATHFDETTHENFFRTELYLASIAPTGFLFILWLNTVDLPGAVPSLAVQTTARVPVVLVGILSGFELPLLLSMVEAEYGRDTPLPSSVQSIITVTRSLSYRIVSLLFHTSRSSERYSTYSTVLAMDYLGGLGGALVYVFVLYPRLGLIPSIFLLALFNCVAALFFVVRFSSRRWGLFPTEDRVIVTREQTLTLLACLLLTAGYIAVGVSHSRVDDELTSYYVEGLIEQEYPQDTINATITSQETTQYQHVVRYTREWAGNSTNQLFAGDSERCMRLDTAIQLCDSWVHPYHSALVDVPMTMYANGTTTDVLLVGGGDWIAVDYLRKHGVAVDQVDIDGEFMRSSRTDPYLQQYHNNAYEYENLSSHQADIYTYLQGTNETYDLVLLDLPGAKTEASLNLYSSEFYKLLRTHLSDRGVVVTWAYSKYAYPEHHKAYLNTVATAGFTQYVGYWAHADYNDDGNTQRGERFYIFAPTDRHRSVRPQSGTAYVQQYRRYYADRPWRPIPTYRGVRPNSVFHPNYDIIIK
jgi:spermidine synthase